MKEGRGPTTVLEGKDLTVRIMSGCSIKREEKREISHRCSGPREEGITVAIEAIGRKAKKVNRERCN